MTQSTYRFSQRVDNYIKYRPRYPQSVLELLKADCGLSSEHAVVDVGTGTGLLAELFLNNGNSVTGVEPDPVMRKGADYYLRDTKVLPVSMGRPKPPVCPITAPIL